MNNARSVLKYLTLSIITILLLGIGYSYLFGDKIEDIIIGNINSKLKKEILTSEIELSLLSNFPFTSIKISDLLIHDSSNNDDTLLYAALATVKLNTFDILSQKYTIRNLDFFRANLKIKYDKIFCRKQTIPKKQKKKYKFYFFEKIEILKISEK